MRSLPAPLVLVVAGTLALSGPAAAQVPTEDSVTGTATSRPSSVSKGLRRSPASHLSSNASHRTDTSSTSTAGPNGENPHGTVTFATGERQGLALDSGSVTCLAVSGNRASVGVNFPGLSPAFPAGQPHAAIIFVEDNGGEGQDRLAVQNLPAGSSAPFSCPDRPSPGVILGPTHARRFTDESVTITDAQPWLPTSKDQCKRGRWESFGSTLKNQGECVAFVERSKGPPR